MLIKIEYEEDKLAWKIYFYRFIDLCRQKQGASPVYITWSFILHITLRMSHLYKKICSMFKVHSGCKKKENPLFG